MCLAIYKPAGIDIPEKNLRNGFESNNDGCGLCWGQNGELHVEKGMLTWDAFYGLYQAAKEFPMLIHFRKSTHGKKDENNCHPFLFNDNKLALIHNGVLPIKCNEDGFSDTWHFVHKVLEPIVKDHGVSIDNQALSWFIRVSIGTDKIAVMDGKGEVVIFNEDKGNWEDTDTMDGKKGKVWYSNYSFRFESSTRRTYGNNSSSRNTTSTQSVFTGSSRSVESEEDENAEWTGYAYSQGHNNTASTKPLEIAGDADRGPGKMTEYGWYDVEIEKEIDSIKNSSAMSREDAIIHVFNNA